MLDINLPKDALKELKNSLSDVPGKAEKAAIRAMNKTSTFSKREQTKQILKQYPVEKWIPKDFTSTRKASKSNSFSQLITINRRNSLDRFKVKEKPGQYPGGIHVYTEKGKPHVRNRKLFFGYWKNGPYEAGLFMRTGKKTSKGKQEIIKPYGPSLGDMALNPHVEANVIAATQDKLIETLEKEMEKELK